MSFSSLLLIGEPLVNAGIWSGRRATTFSNDFSPEALKRFLPIFHVSSMCVFVHVCVHLQLCTLVSILSQTHCMYTVILLKQKLMIFSK